MSSRVAPASSYFRKTTWEFAPSRLLRSAAAVEQTFGGITTRLWDDPFEWTLPEKLSSTDLLIGYLNEVEQTRTVLQVALARLAISERAVAQSAEAHRIVARKYEGGLAGVAELLDAQAAATQSALGFSQARWSAVAAAAERLRALGKDPGSLEALDRPDSRPTSQRN